MVGTRDPALAIARQHQIMTFMVAMEEKGHDGATPREVQAGTDLPRATVYRRMRFASILGYLRIVAWGPGRGRHRYHLTDYGLAWLSYMEQRRSQMDNADPWQRAEALTLDAPDLDPDDWSDVDDDEGIPWA